MDYILRHIDWKGEGDILDPACGSGGFLVRALNVLLDDMKQRNISEEVRLKAISRVVGLDINPFATHIAEMNLLFLILDTYLRAREEAQKEGKDLRLGRLPVHTMDSLLGTVSGPQGEGTTRSLFMPLAQLGSLEEAFQARDKLGEYDYLVMNPPYVRNERLPEEPRQIYRHVFNDVAAMNADIFTYFMKKAVLWLKDETGRLGVIVSLGLADSGANEKLRKFLSGYTIERVVSLEWCQVFVANVNPILLFLKRATPPPGHKVALVHGISSLEDLDKEKGQVTYIEQERWLKLAPDGSWRVEVKESDLSILEKMRTVPARLRGHYGIEMGPRSGEHALIGDDPTGMKNPYPLLDGREVKAWSIEWQGNYIDYQPHLIEASKNLEFFKAPKVLSRRISLTTQAAVDDSSKPLRLFRNTVMVVQSPLRELNEHPYVVASLMNSLPLRYYAFLMLRSGVIQQGYSTFYAAVIGSLPVPDASYKDSGICNSLNTLSHQAHALSGEMVNGDKELLQEVDHLLGKNLIPFAQLPLSDLSGYFAEVDMATAQVSETGELTCSKMGIIKGHPAILQYIVSRATLQGRDSLSKMAIENFLVPKELGACIEALHQMDIWAQRKPTLSVKLADVQAEIDRLLLSTFTVLTDDDRKHIQERAKQFPLNQVLLTDIPGAPTRRIPIKYWEIGERYRS